MVLRLEQHRGLFSLRKFSINEVFRDLSIVHACNMAKPAHPSLFQQRAQSSASSSFQDSLSRDLVLPGDVQKASEAAQLEGIRLPLLSGVQSPGPLGT